MSLSYDPQILNTLNWNILTYKCHEEIEIVSNHFKAHDIRVHFKRLIPRSYLTYNTNHLIGALKLMSTLTPSYILVGGHLKEVVKTMIHLSQGKPISHQARGESMQQLLVSY